jgi:hypothetical protein
MDPYLEDERLWPNFHHQLISCLDQILVPGLDHRYHIQVANRAYTLGTPESPALQEEYLEIRLQSDGRLISLIDVVSPANKTTPSGRDAYLQARREARKAGANVVEIDLVLQGPPMLDYSREGLPDWDYAVTVARSTHPERFEIYTASLQKKKLPRFRLPLAADDRDTVLDLAAAVARAYDQGNFAAKIDYARDAPTAVIAALAYQKWQREGRQHGHDKEHWLSAISELRSAMGQTQ